MNARVEFPVVEPAGELVLDHVRLAMKRLLASPVFSKAPRMSDLLSFLVEKKICGKEHELTEYAIGLNVFRRDVRVYETVLDPVVRVQVGRLRDRLATYYAATDGIHDVRISIPVGTYVPVLLQAPTGVTADRPRMLELAPLRDLTGDSTRAIFVAGVNEELSSRLFRAFGATIQVRDRCPDAWPRNGEETPAPRRIEGSVRVENDHVRTSLRLVDTASGRIEWVSQFDCRGELGIRLQEQLSDAVCERLQGYLVS